jgi:diguanylate cyclase (GGDEF)-like protein
LIRGAKDSATESPAQLFAEAYANKTSAKLDRQCRRTVTAAFGALHLPGKLFVNILPASLSDIETSGEMISTFLDQVNLRPDQIVVEITESQPFNDVHLIQRSIGLLRAMGFQIALDDLGEGYASLRLWLELKPDYVKIDKLFIQGIHQDSFKLQFVRAINRISESTGTAIIAEGIETEADLLVVRDIGIEYAQGFFFAHPSTHPAATLTEAAINTIGARLVAVANIALPKYINRTQIGKLVTAAESVSPITPNDQIMMRFNADANLASIPVVVDSIPVGLVRRARFVQEFARPFRHELYDKRPCALFMDNDPLVVEATMPIAEVSELISEVDRRHLASGFIITENNRYLGMGSGQSLVRELTEMQINNARYSNPLTLLPGNVPIDEHVDQLLAAKNPFVAAYCDIDHFKPYNDLYGYRKGDDMISAVSQSLLTHTDATRDFVGHVGGDDFILHLQSSDWQTRLTSIIDAFKQVRQSLLKDDDLARGHYQAKNRKGKSQSMPIPSLSIGVVHIEAEGFDSAQDVSHALAEAKRQAKKTKGDSIFIERRKYLL